MNHWYYAFPSSEEQTPGLLKRELLAALMLSGLLARGPSRLDGRPWHDLPTLAVCAVEAADALLSALAEPAPPPPAI